MKREEIQDAIKKNKDLPTLSEFYLRFRQKIADPSTSATEIANVIASDQVITSRVLRTANSPFYGLVSRITTIPHAIVVIGFNGIHYIILNTAVFNLFNKAASSGIDVFDISRLWQHSSAVAILSRLIAKKINFPAYEEMFTAGLLHDIGKLYIYKNYSSDFVEIIRQVQQEKVHIREAEDKVLGINHAEIGELLLKEWNLPEDLLFTTAYHHNPVLAKNKDKPASIVHLADILCRSLEIGSGGDNTIPPLNYEAWDKLGLEVDDLDDIIKDVDKELKHFEVFTAKDDGDSKRV